MLNMPMGSGASKSGASESKKEGKEEDDLHANTQSQNFHGRDSTSNLPG